MRLPRVILDPEACAYHLVNRTIDQIWFFKSAAQKSQIVEIIRASSDLYGVNLFNYSVLSNHMHILCNVYREENRESLTKTSLIKIAKVLYCSDYVADLKQEFERAEKIDKQTGDNWHTQNILNRYEQRRGCLSTYMKEVKERIARYINKQYNRKGSVWDGRYKNPLVEHSLESLLAVSAYIDLNSIRAGIVDKPEDYRWCGYAAALAGNRQAQRGIAQLYAYRGSKKPTWNQIQSEYRQSLFEKGLEILEDPDSGIKGRLGFTAEQVDEEICKNGKLSRGEVLLHRIRYFSDGAIIGSAAFVDEVFANYREKLTAPNSLRSTGARKMRGADWGNLACLRDLRVDVIGQRE